MKAKKVVGKARATAAAKASAKPKPKPSKAKTATRRSRVGTSKSKRKTPKAGVTAARTTRTGARILFGTGSQQTNDVQTLVRIARTLAAGGGADGHFFMLYGRLEGACVAAIDALRRHEVPACVVEVAAAATVVSLAKDYAVHGFLERASRLLLERPECAATAHRVAVLGSASQARACFGETRPALFGLAGEPHADALLAAIDVIGAGSHDAAERLVRLADTSLGTPSIVWLAEIAARTTGDSARQRKMRRTLDDLLDSDAFGAREAASFVHMGRGRLDAMDNTLGETWRALSGLKRGTASVELLPPIVAEVREKADSSANQRALLEEIERTEAELAESERQWRDVYGPFYGLNVPPNIAGPLDEAAHYAVTGFRELYGLETLRESLPDLASLAKVGRSEPN